MKKLLFLLIIFLFSIVLYSQDYEINEEIIKNGPNVIFINGDDKNYVSVSIFIEFGENIPGLAHLAEHLVFASNSKMEAGKLDYLMESLGATCDAYTNYDYSVYKYIIKKENFNKSLEYLSYALLNNKTEEKEFNIEKQIIKDEFFRKQYVNFEYIRMVLQKSLYGDSYYGNPLEGESIDNISLTDLQDFYSNNYISKNMSIIIYGNVNKKEILDTISKYYIQENKNSFDIPIKVKTNNKSLFINGPKNYYGIMFPMAPSYLLKDAITCDVISQLFDLLSSRIINEKYKYKSTYIHNTGKYASPFSLIYQCDDIDFVKSVIDKTNQDIQNGNFSENDILNAQNIIISDYLAKNTNIDEITYNTGFNYVIYDYNTSYSYDNFIRQINKEDIINISKKYLTKYCSLVCEADK